MADILLLATTAYGCCPAEQSQVEMLTVLNSKAFQLLLHWLQPILPCRNKLDTLQHALEEDDKPAQAPQDLMTVVTWTVLLVLMHIRQGPAQKDLASHFHLDQSSVNSPQLMDTCAIFPLKGADQMAINHHRPSGA